MVGWLGSARTSQPPPPMYHRIRLAMEKKFHFHDENPLAPIFNSNVFKKKKFCLKERHLSAICYLVCPLKYVFFIGLNFVPNFIHFH